MSETSPRPDPSALSVVPVEMWLEDTGVGWAELQLAIGEPDSDEFERHHWAVTLVLGAPIKELARFVRDLKAGRDAGMMLHHEPGHTLCTARAAGIEGVVLLEADYTDGGGATVREVSVLCARDALVEAMHQRMPWLAQTLRDLDRVEPTVAVRDPKRSLAARLWRVFVRR
jgi:hypothetical protein